MKKPSLWLAAIAATAFIVACGYSYKQGTFFTKTWQSDYVQVSACAETEHPAGGWQRVLATPKAAAQFKAKSWPIAEGEIFLKAQYKDPNCTGSVDAWTVMRKGKPGTAPKSGDWEWQTVWGSSGEIATQGQPRFCIDCHDGCAGSDTDWLCTANQ